MKIAITGKGGVGKTTLSSILCRLYAEQGKNIFAIDADPDANLALALGFPEDLIEKVVPLTQLKSMIEERTNSKSDNYGTFFKINPKVDDLPTKYGTVYNGVNVLAMGSVEKGGKGCLCPENVLLKRLMKHLLTEEDDVVILDMEAGLEHFSRNSSGSVDAFIVVVEPGIRSIQTFHNITKLAENLGVDKVWAVANKIEDENDKLYIHDNIPDVLGFLSYNKEVSNSDRLGMSTYDACPKIVEEVKLIKNKLDNLCN